MRLKHFVIFLSLLYAVVICGGLVFYRVGFVYPQLVEATQAMHRQDIAAVEKALRTEQGHLRLLANDWAKWNDAFEFVVQPSDEFVESNLIPSTFVDANLHGVYFLNIERQLVFGLEREENHTAISEIAAHSPHLLALAAAPSPRDDFTHCGFVWVHEELEAYCIASIQNSEMSEPANGYLIFTRIMDVEAVNLLNDITQVRFKLLSPTENLNQSAHTLERVRQTYMVPLQGESGITELFVRIDYDPALIPEKLDSQTLLMMLVLMLLPLAIYLVVNKLVVEPIASMSTFITHIRPQDEMPKLLDGGRIKEVQIFKQAVETLMQHIRNEHFALEQKSLTDGLTGIKNRRAFDEQLPMLWKAVARLHKPVVMIVADIDYFKQYNDSLGHLKGDQALQAVALALRSVCRRSSDQIYRYGGEEFVITMALERIEDLTIVLDNIQKSVGLLYYPHPSSPISSLLTLSMGACLIEQPGSWLRAKSYKDAFEVADRALYEAKAAGRNTFSVHRLEP